MRLVWDPANEKAANRPVNQWETSTGYKPHCNNPCPRRWLEQTEVELKLNILIYDTVKDFSQSLTAKQCEIFPYLAMADGGRTDIRPCWASKKHENIVTHLLRWHSSGCWGCRMTSPRWPRTGKYQRPCGPTPAPPGCGVWHKDDNKRTVFPVLCVDQFFSFLSETSQLSYTTVM